MNSFPSCAESCPLGGQAWMDDRLRAPVGLLRRVGAANEEVDETKRNLLKLAAVAGVLGVGVGGAVGGALQYVKPPVVGLASYPQTLLLDVDGSPLTLAAAEANYSSDTAEDVLFNYPLTNEPNFFLNLYPAAQNVLNGVGTHNSIVAFSAICQHLGCIAPSISYYPPGQCAGKSFKGLNFYIHCSCHGSTYDVTNGAANLTGPAVLPLPQVTLKVSGGLIYATSLAGPPVNGHLNSLQGGYGVGTSSGLGKDPAVWDCSSFR
jgi:Rieske Fe-S protein